MIFDNCSAFKLSLYSIILQSIRFSCRCSWHFCFTEWVGALLPRDLHRGDVHQDRGHGVRPPSGLVFEKSLEHHGLYCRCVGVRDDECNVVSMAPCHQISADVDANWWEHGEGIGARLVHTEDSQGVEAAKAGVGRAKWVHHFSLLTISSGRMTPILSDNISHHYPNFIPRSRSPGGDVIHRQGYRPPCQHRPPPSLCHHHLRHHRSRVLRRGTQQNLLRPDGPKWVMGF